MRPRTQSIYSDLGFMLLGFILEDARTTAGARGRLEPSAALSAQFRKVASFVTAEPLMFNPAARVCEPAPPRPSSMRGGDER